MNKFTITVPASSANVGPGFDSVGIALNKYLSLDVEKAAKWEFIHLSEHLPPIKNYKDHLIYQVAKETAEQFGDSLPPCRVKVQSEIPLARGLGSSASAIVAGIELANQLCQLQLPLKEKLILATKKEGHPDNVAPSLLGGLVIATPILSNGNIEYFQKIDQQLEFVVTIPDYKLETVATRKVLPQYFSRKEATAASAIANVVFAALIAGDYELAGNMMEHDLFHEPYRAYLIPEFFQIRKEAKLRGAYGTVISGAGPSILSVVPKGKGKDIAAYLKQQFPNYSIEVLTMDTKGIRVSPCQSSIAL